MFTFTTYTPIFSQKTPKIGTKSGQFGQNSENHEFTPKIGATNNTGPLIILIVTAASKFLDFISGLFK